MNLTNNFHKFISVLIISLTIFVCKCIIKQKSTITTYKKTYFVQTGPYIFWYNYGKDIYRDEWVCNIFLLNIYEILAVPFI